MANANTKTKSTYQVVYPVRYKGKLYKAGEKIEIEIEVAKNAGKSLKKVSSSSKSGTNNNNN